MSTRILLVDDEPAIIFGYSRYLSAAGYNVEEATCLAEAKERLTQQRFDAVILDLKLPDGNALGSIDGLKRDYPDMIIIVVTGETDAAVKSEALNRGADEFYVKPVSLDDLAACLLKRLRKSKTHNPGH
ncbi:MAG: response regulator [Acidobacteriia bacterium]|nr:response regulator [Terriglobia bacterium]